MNLRRAHSGNVVKCGQIDLCHSVGRPKGLKLPSRKGRRRVHVQVSFPPSVLRAGKRKQAWSGDSPRLPQELGYGMSLGLQLSFPTSLAVSAFFFLSSSEIIFVWGEAGGGN